MPVSLLTASASPADRRPLHVRLIQHLLAQSPTVQNLPSNAFTESDDSEAEYLRLRSRLIPGQQRSLVGHPKGNLQHSPETRKLLNPSNAQVQERLARLFSTLHSAGPRLIEPSVAVKKSASRPSRPPSSSLPKRNPRRSAAVEQLLFAVAREPSSAVRSRATNRPRASSVGARIPSRGYASVASETPLAPDETPYTHARDQRAEATLRQLDMEETSALVKRIADTLADASAKPPWVAGRQRTALQDSTRASSSAILSKIGPILYQLRNPRQFRPSGVLPAAKKIFEQATAVPVQQRTTFFNARIVTLLLAIFRSSGSAGLKPSKDDALEWIRSFAVYDALDSRFLTSLIEFLAIHPNDTVPASLSELLALPDIQSQAGLQEQVEEEQDHADPELAELDPRIAEVLSKPVRNFDFAVALLHAVNGDPSLQPTRIWPYSALLELAAAKGDARAGLELLALMQENDSLPAGYLDPKAFTLILRSLVGDKLLLPENLNVDISQPLSQHTIAPLDTDDAWKRDALEVVQAVFDEASPHWSLEDAPKQTNSPDTRSERAFIDTSDGVFRASDHPRPLLTAWNSLIHAHFLVGHPEGAIALFKRMVDVQVAEPNPTMALHTPPPTRDTVSIMLAGLTATQGVLTATEWYNALLTAEEPTPVPSFEGLLRFAAMYAQSAKGEADTALWDKGKASGAYSRLLQAITNDLQGKHQRRKALPLSLLETLISPNVVAKMDEPQLSPLLALLGASFAPTVARGDGGLLKKTDQLTSSLLFLADKCMSYDRAADAASILTYVLRCTTLSSQAALGDSLNETRLHTGAQRRTHAAVAKRMLHLIRLTRRIPVEEVSAAAAALLGTALTTFTPMLELYPSLLHSVVDKKTALPRAHLWATRLTGLYRQAAPHDRDAVLSRLSADEWTILVRAFSHEEQHLEPDQARMVSSGVGMLAEDYARVLPVMTSHVRPKDGHLVRPNVEQAAEVLLARYPESDVIALLEKINPSYLRMLHTKPWDTLTVDDEALQPPAPATELPQMSARALQALGPVQPSESVSSDPQLGFASVLELSEDLGGKALETLNSNTTNKAAGSDARLRRTWDLLLLNARQGVYPTPAFLAALINVAGVRRDMDHVRLLYLLASHVVRSLEGIAQASAWVEVENAMICAAAHSGQCRLANSHRHLLVNAGQVPSADAYGSLIAASKVTTDEVFVSKELFDEAIRLGAKPNLYLFNTIISTFSRARRAETALTYYKMMQAHKIKPSSITYGALINAFVRRGEINQALQFFQRMEASPDFRPSAAPYNTLIGYYVRQGDRPSALELITKMRAHKLAFSGYSWKLLLDTYGLIEPVDEPKLIETFNEIAVANAVEGTHLATLITSYGINGNNLEKAQGIYESITPFSGRRNAPPLPDAVCHQSMMEVFVHHKRVDLLFDFIKRLASHGARFTAYHANVAIRAYGANDERGLTEARRVFASMRDPPTGVAAIGNHASRADGKGNKKDVLKLPSYYASLMPGETDATAAAASAAVSGSPPARSATATSRRSSSSSANPWQRTFREPSTYIAMIQAELAAGNLEPAQWLLERMYERAFPAPILAQVRTLIADYEKIGPAAVTVHPLLQSSKPRGTAHRPTASTSSSAGSAPTSPATQA